MNRKQKAVIWIALAVFGLTVLQAPWGGTDSRRHFVTVMAPVWSAPQASYSTPAQTKLMLGALLVEWFAIGIVSGVLVFLFKKPSP